MGAVRVRGQTNCSSIGRSRSNGGAPCGYSKLLPVIALLPLLFSCGGGPDPRLLDTGNIDLSPKQPAKLDTGRGSAGGSAGKGTYQVYPGNDAPSVKQMVSKGRAAVAKAEGGGYQINLDNASIADATKLILGDTLGETYVLDPRVQGTITISSPRPLTTEQVLAAFEAALHSNAAVLIKEAGHYKIVPSGDVAEGEMGSADVVDDNAKTTPGYGVSVLPLRYVSAQSIMELLDTFITRDSSVKAWNTGNLVLLRGTAAERQSLVDVVMSFDVDWMKRQSASVVTLANSAPEDVVPKLEAIFADDTTAAGSNAVRFVALERLNGVLIIGNNQEKVKRAVTWVARLDREGAEGMNYYTYFVQNGKAADVAKVLQATFTDQTTGLDTSAVNPEQQQFQKSTLTGGPTTGTGTGTGTTPNTGNSGGQDTGTQTQGSGSPAGKSDLQGSTTFGEASAQSTTGTQPPTGGKGAIRITASTTNNTLVIRATAHDYRKVLAVLRSIDSPGLQVMVNTTIAEVVLTDELRYGVQAYFKANNAAGGIFNGDRLVLRPSFPGLNFILGSTSDPRLVLDALSAVTSVRVVSSPSVVVLENQPATIKIGDQVPITVQEAQATETPNAPIINSIEYRDTGVILQVIPRVNSAGLVTMLISQELSAVVPNSGSGSDKTNTPTISQRSVTSTVSVYSDQTVVLGGLISGQLNYTRDSVPIVNKIPLIGDIIGDTAKTGKRTELVVFITPRVIKDSIDASIVSEELRSKMKLLR
jgi:general secretion pathway protein D